jgi:two-component sensor histidine kinase
MQARQADDRQVLNLFEEARNRVASIASIHELIYRSGSFSKIELLAYTRHLVPYLISFYRADRHITCSIEGAGIMLDLERAVPCGLLINELISNVCKHAFPNQEWGNLFVRLDQDAEYVRLMVRDTVIGLPNGFDYRESPTLGLQLVQTLVDQLGGTVSFNSDSGTVVEVSISRV